MDNNMDDNPILKNAHIKTIWCKLIVFEDLSDEDKQSYVAALKVFLPWMVEAVRDYKINNKSQNTTDKGE